MIHMCGRPQSSEYVYLLDLSTRVHRPAIDRTIEMTAYRGLVNERTLRPPLRMSSVCSSSFRGQVFAHHLSLAMHLLLSDHPQRHEV